MSPAVRLLDAGGAERLLKTLASDADSWPPGSTHVLEDEDRPSAVLRVGAPEPGEGYHREHVRLLHGAGERRALARLVGEVVAGLDERLRLESVFPTGEDASWAAACESAGLVREGALPEAWRGAPGRAATGLEHWGRPGRRRREPGPASVIPPTRAEGRAGFQVVPHRAGTRDRLRDFLDALVPGRSYPAGTLLSDAERAETRRSGDLSADWMLALDADGRVAAGVVLEVDGRIERAHVRRLHVDVLPPHRGRGLATRLLRAARRSAALLGAERVEADPRAGHSAVIAALEGAGLVARGRQAGAWRMRTATASWDEDVLLMSAPVLRD